MTRSAYSPFCRHTPQLSGLRCKPTGVIQHPGPPIFLYIQKPNNLASRYSRGRFHFKIPESFKAQLKTFNGHVGERLLKCLTPHEQRLFHAVDALRHIAANVYQTVAASRSPSRRPGDEQHGCRKTIVRGYQKREVQNEEDEMFYGGAQGPGY